MIYYLKGKLTCLNTGFLVIDVNGVGYKCFTDNRTLNDLVSKINSEIKLFTTMVVREDSISLFGFLQNERLNCFKKLTSVSGVGSKVALSMLSEFAPEQIAMFVTSGDSKSLTKASGLGNKLAQRIVLELKDKMKIPGTVGETNFGVASASNNVSQAMNALSVLGYSDKDVMPILLKLDSSLSVETMIQSVLRSIG